MSVPPRQSSSESQRSDILYTLRGPSSGPFLSLTYYQYQRLYRRKPRPWTGDSRRQDMLTRRNLSQGFKPRAVSLAQPREVLANLEWVSGEQATLSAEIPDLGWMEFDVPSHSVPSDAVVGDKILIWLRWEKDDVSSIAVPSQWTPPASSLPLAPSSWNDAEAVAEYRSKLKAWEEQSGFQPPELPSV